MTSAEPVDLYVDTRALQETVEDLTRLSNRLSGLVDSGALALDSESAGSAELSEALARFLRRWSFARESLVEKLLAARDIANGAVTAYEATENGLTGAVQPDGVRSA